MTRRERVVLCGDTRRPHLAERPAVVTILDDPLLEWVDAQAWDCQVGPLPDGVHVGVDPGQSAMGLALGRANGRVRVWQLDYKGLFPSRAEGIHYITYLVPHLLDLDARWLRGVAAVEDAAFNMGRGQVHLAEGRAAAAIGLVQAGFRPVFYPPATVRKAVFGYGYTKAEDMWHEWLPKDAASALAVLLCGVFKSA